MTLFPDEENRSLWHFDVLSSVVNNTEQINILFEAGSDRVIKRSRLSRGSGQRMKSYQYKDQYVLRERRNQTSDPALPPEEWPVSSTQEIPYPATKTDTVITSPYLLMLIAQKLQSLGPNKSREVLVLTDRNFYRVKLSSGRGIPIDVDYQVDGRSQVSGERETLAVSIQVSPEGRLSDDNDFSLLGLIGDIIIFFDSESQLPVQVLGQAPRIGKTGINLKAVTMRTAEK